MPRPRKQDFETWWSWHQADKGWLRQHGGRLWTTLLIAVLIGLISGSAAVLILLIIFAVGMTIWARLRP